MTDKTKTPKPPVVPKADADAKAKADADAKAKADADAKAKADADAKAKTEVMEAEAKVRADTKAKDDAEAKAKEVKKPPFTVADGKSITCRKGVIGPGEEIRADWLGGGMDSLKSLVETKSVDRN